MLTAFENSRLRRPEMTIKVGDKLPDGKLSESTEYDAAAGCPINPKDISVADAVKGKIIAIFAVSGAYTPTCSAKHVPSYVKNYRTEEHTSELQSLRHLVCRLLLEKKQPDF